MNKSKCECRPCDCSSEGKKNFHQLLEETWELMPDHLHDILHSLSVQKSAVLHELKEWADTHEQPELSEVCKAKISKIEKCMQKEQEN